MSLFYRFGLPLILIAFGFLIIAGPLRYTQNLPEIAANHNCTEIESRSPYGPDYDCGRLTWLISGLKTISILILMLNPITWPFAFMQIGVGGLWFFFSIIKPFFPPDQKEPIQTH